VTTPYPPSCAVRERVLMPFESKAVRVRRRAEVRRRDGDGPCALQMTVDCLAVGGEIDYGAKPPHPRSFEVDHIVSSDEAMRLGWPLVEADALDNCQAACRQCNRQKSSGVRPSAPVRPTYINPRFM
jgi:5-methylcytosine-specific restriction endonuclease McrA